MSKNIAVVLCGCGFKDGSEIHESVSTLIALDSQGATYQCYAPIGPQARVINHLTTEVQAGEERIMIEEAARIARSNIKNISELNSGSADALIFPGGFGAAFNLCDFAVKGEYCTVHPEVKRVIEDFYVAKKPLGFICIAPSFAASVLGKHSIELTIGEDQATAAKITAMGAKHIPKAATEVHIDKANKIVSTPAYMLAKGPSEVFSGITKLVKSVLELA